MESVIGQVMDFCGDLPILGHHVIFDYSFLKRAAVNAGFPFERTGIDTLGLCRPVYARGGEKESVRRLRLVSGSGGDGPPGALRRQNGPFPVSENQGSEHFRHEETFLPKPLIYKVKREQPASKKQKKACGNWQNIIE